MSWNTRSQQRFPPCPLRHCPASMTSRVPRGLGKERSPTGETHKHDAEWMKPEPSIHSPKQANRRMYAMSFHEQVQNQAKCVGAVRGYDTGYVSGEWVAESDPGNTGTPEAVLSFRFQVLVPWVCSPNENPASYIHTTCVHVHAHILKSKAYPE